MAGHGITLSLTSPQDRSRPRRTAGTEETQSKHRERSVCPSVNPQDDGATHLRASAGVSPDCGRVQPLRCRRAACLQAQGRGTRRAISLGTGPVRACTRTFTHILTHTCTQANTRAHTHARTHALTDTGTQGQRQLERPPTVSGRPASTSDQDTRCHPPPRTLRGAALTRQVWGCLGAGTSCKGYQGEKRRVTADPAWKITEAQAPGGAHTHHVVFAEKHKCLGYPKNQHPVWY